MSIKKQVEQKFDYDVTALQPYIDEQSDVINTRLVTEGITLSVINIQTGIKFKEKIKLLDTTVDYQDADCEMVAGGTTTFSDVEIEVAPIGFYKKYCNSDLVGVWTQLALRAGMANENEEFVFEEELVGLMMKKNSLRLENLIWQGDKLSGDANLNKIDGFSKILTVVNGCVNLNPDADPVMDNTNAFATFRKIFQTNPKSVRREEDFVCFAGDETFQSLMANIVDLNLFHYDPAMIRTDIDRIKVPGTNMTVINTTGLDGNDNVYTGKASEFTFGTDFESDFEEFKMWYDINDDVLKIRVKFRAGVQVPFLDQIGVWVPA